MSAKRKAPAKIAATSRPARSTQIDSGSSTRTDRSVASLRGRKGDVLRRGESPRSADEHRKKASTIDDDFPSLTASIRGLVDAYENDSEMYAVRAPGATE